MAKKIKSPYKAWRKYRRREETCTTLHKVFDYATPIMQNASPTST